MYISHCICRSQSTLQKIFPHLLRKRERMNNPIYSFAKIQFLAHHDGMMYSLSSGSIVMLTILKMVIKHAITATILHVEAAGKRTPTCPRKILQNQQAHRAEKQL